MSIELGIILTGLAILFIGTTYWEIKKNGLREWVLTYILDAEQKIATGDEKFSEVCARLSNLITGFFPKWIAVFITPEFVENFVQNTFDAVKDILDYRGEKFEDESK